MKVEPHDDSKTARLESTGFLLTRSGFGPESVRLNIAVPAAGGLAVELECRVAPSAVRGRLGREAWAQLYNDTESRDFESFLIDGGGELELVDSAVQKLIRLMVVFPTNVAREIEVLVSTAVPAGDLVIGRDLLQHGLYCEHPDYSCFFLAESSGRLLAWVQGPEEPHSLVQGGSRMLL